MIEFRLSSRRAAMLLAAGLVVGAGGLVGCKKGSGLQKILDGAPVGSPETVIPAEATQQMLILKRDALQVLIPVINRLPQTNATFPELTPAGGNEYRFTVTNERYGAATYEITFRDPGGTPIDPVSNAVSTTTLKSVLFTTSGSSSLFTFTETLVVTLGTAGDVASPKRVTGTSTFLGRADATNLVYEFPAPGAETNFGGLINGNVLTTSGTGADGAPARLQLSFSTNHDANGIIAWAGRDGDIHITDNGSGVILTPENRILLD